MKRIIWIFLLLMILPIILIYSAPNKKAIIEQDTNMESFRAKVEEMQKLEDRFMPDTKRKNAECIDLVERGVQHLKSKDLEVACHDFRFLNEWRRGEIFVFVLDEEGYILCHGDNSNIIWKNINFAPSFIGEPIFDTIKKINPKGEWVNYRWNNGYKSAYMKQITLNNNTYYIGAGYFPQSKEYIAEQLVKTAVQYFKQVPQQVAFTRISNPNDVFVIGDVSMYVGDFNANMLADATELAFIGQNLRNLKDSRGNYAIRDIINSLKKAKSSWVDIYWLNELQKNYVERVANPNSDTDYFFAAGYYPDVKEVAAVNLLNEAINHINRVGTKKAFADFSNPLGEFVKGRLTLFVYDFEGKNLANGEYPILVGQNVMERKDREGKFITKEIIELAKKQGQGIVATFDKNSYEKLFIKTVDTPEGKVILVAGVYIQSKALSVQAMVEKALRYLPEHSMVEALNTFTDTQGEFYAGDVYLFMYNTEGIALANGEHKNMIWQDYIRVKDSEGQRILENIIQLARKGGGWYTYPSRNAQRRIYVRPIMIENKQTKKKEMFIMGSGYYL